MSCSHCQAIEDYHNQKVVKQELSRYRKKGPDGATRKLIAALQKEDYEELSTKTYRAG